MTVENITEQKVASYLKTLLGGCNLRIKDPSGNVIVDSIAVTANLSGTTLLLHGETTLSQSAVPATIELYDSSGNVYLTTTGSSQTAPAGSKVIIDWSINVY
ncbi:MAG: hypothetical protein GXO43_02195 [Crenarchaeota archaeon]|nr:hypothetical protein [Thermoproteota archaeon]